MKKVIELLNDRKIDIDELLESPDSLLSEITVPHHRKVDWDDFTIAKLELEQELDEIDNSCSTVKII
ncbi:hypothetical protein MAR621_03150 [Maribacter dokdonensis]|uniref:hypothetical protein n=1 Tax=Maribacter dokdonensis TaxID=320912 RepID=UPI001B2BD2EE|nr:hypothetical protein [Maribacter dokdonensis]CAG2532956.1 hypothetical protein MAR621_03150 [Maribacter dokdonensis]